MCFSFINNLGDRLSFRNIFDCKNNNDIHKYQTTYLTDSKYFVKKNYSDSLQKLKCVLLHSLFNAKS